MDLAEFFRRDRSADGVFKSNLFNELLGAAGTTAAAMAVKDMIMQVGRVHVVAHHLHHVDFSLVTEHTWGFVLILNLL